MTLNQLRYFCTASRCHSATKAAQELYVTQPAISLAIRQLENEFHLTLFSRDGNRLELTAEGEKFYESATRLLQYGEEMQMQFSQIARDKPTLRVGIPPMLSTLFFPELLDDFHQVYPDIPVMLDEFGSFRACELVQSEQLDLAIVNMELYNIDKFNTSLLFTDSLIYCVSPDNPRAAQKDMRLEDFEGEDLILFNADSVQIHLLRDFFESLHIRPRILMRSSQLYTVMKFLRRGNCGCFLFSRMLPSFPECVGIPLSPSIDVDVGLVWKKGRYVNREIKRFISFVQKRKDALAGGPVPSVT